ncbi:MAG TPA: tryptophan synthase subunit alpha [Burkholderiaceae bacterium]|nr:tryptophan synthase subunit alpha [Burkholderiaceae bacterium]
MNAIDRCFQATRAAGRVALMPYVTMGYPARDDALGIIPALAQAGADIVEIGVPFTDPIADGPVIQASSQRALDNGMSLDLALRQLKSLDPSQRPPALVLMTYTNVLMSRGFDAFALDARDAGISGVIVPDMPVEEGGELRDALARQGLYAIQMVTPNLDDDRIREIAAVARGFLYLVSVLGVTGERSAAPDVEAFVARVRRHTALPLALGFGIATPAHAHAVAPHVDGVIVGSALSRRLGAASDPVAEARDFLSDFAGVAA